VHIKLKRSPGIYLAGFMGSGKSTVGRLLADQLGWEFVDVDAEIEAKEHCTVRKIFEERGEPEFRKVEAGMINSWVRRVECGMPAVIALGGGAFVDPHNFAMIRDHGVSIWLDCSLESISQRIADEIDHRPLARDPDRFRELFEERKAGYSRADFRVDGNCEVESVVASIMDLPLWK